jgi:predicted transport protein
VLKVEVAYPFLLEAYEDYSGDLIDKDELLYIVRLVESYVFRRAICGIPTNSLNKTFATLMRSMDKERYLESLKVVFYTLGSYRRFPSDAEFKQEFMVKDVYNFRSRNYLLAKLENHGRKEWVNVEEYTIEHVMPQNLNLSQAWQRELGENWKTLQETYLHTLGNLTLTGYNSELSDRPFTNKRDMAGGFKDSPIRLNQSLANLECWNEETIVNRAEQLAEQAIQVWTGLEMSQEVLDQYQLVAPSREGTQYSLESYEYLSGEMLELFEQFRKRVLNLDASVTEVPTKLYIAYKNPTNFVDVVPQKSRLRLSLNLAFDDIHDPRGWCKDVSNVGRWGNGDVEVRLTSPEQLDYVMYLVRQSFERHAELERV